MKKLCVLMMAVIIVFGLAAVAGAQVGTDTDWAVCMEAGNSIWSTSSQNWGAAGASNKFGCQANTPQTAVGAPYVTTPAYVRNYRLNYGGYGLTWDLFQGPLPNYMWDDIRFWAGSEYGSTHLFLRIYGTGIDTDTPALRLEVTQAKEGCGFAVGQVVFDSLGNGTLHDPNIPIDLSQYISGLKGSANDPAVTFRLTASSDQSGIAVTPTPEPASLAAMLTGLVGLAGFALRRRKQ